MNPALGTETSVLFCPSPLRVPPSRALWIGDLRLDCFDEVMRLDHATLTATLEAELCDAPARRARDHVVQRLDASSDPLRHLLLLVRFLEHRKATALLTVARIALDGGELSPLLSDSGRPHRLALALALYERDPKNLVAVMLWDRWHTRRRVSYRLDERHRHLPRLEPSTWLDVAGAALSELQAEAPERFGGLVPGIVTTSVSGSVLFGFREPTHRDTLTCDDGAIISGRHEGWLVLALHEDGATLDVTDQERDRGPALASQILRAVRGGECRYRLISDPLSEERMAAFLGQLTDPRDHSFPLLEITASVLGPDGGTLITLSGEGQVRVESSVTMMRRHMVFALDWRTVRSVKVGFEDRYRFTLEFEDDEAGPVVWYSDRERDKETSRRFEARIRAALGVRIAPRPGVRPRPKREERAPKRESAAWWSALLRPVVDRPASWQAEVWTELAEAGLLCVARSAALRCGTPYLPTDLLDASSRDCPGEVEMGFGSWNPRDPLLQDPEAEFICPVCDRVWWPGRYRLPMVERVRVQVQPETAWKLILAAVGRIAAVQPFPGEPGVAEVRFPTGLYFLAFPPLLAEGSSFAPGAGLATRTAWVTVDPTEALGGVVSLAELLADPSVLAEAWRLPARVAAAATGGAPRAEMPMVTEPRYALSIRGKAVFLDDLRLLSGNASAQRQLLMLLVHLAREDQRRGRPERRGHSVDRIIEVARGFEIALTEDQVRLQLHRLNEAGRTALTRAGFRPVEIVEHVAGGYRVNGVMELAGVAMDG